MLIGRSYVIVSLPLGPSLVLHLSLNLFFTPYPSAWEGRFYRGQFPTFWFIPHLLLPEILTVFCQNKSNMHYFWLSMHLLEEWCQKCHKVI